MKEPIATLLAELDERGWAVETDRPSDETGTWWLDVDAKGQPFVVAWNPDHGYGLSSPDPDAFGEGHDERYETPRDLVARLDVLVDARRSTIPPQTVVLSRLRDRASLTQKELADLLEVQQAAVSKLERRDDMHVSTLARLIAAMGGQLRLVADFAGEVVEVDLPAVYPRVETNSRHVVPHPKGWAVKKSVGKRATSVHETQREAIVAAKTQLRSHGGGELTIHRPDGSVRARSNILGDESTRSASQ